MSEQSNQELRTRVYEFLAAKHDGVLTTVNVSGNPHAAVMYYTVDEELNIYFVTKRDTSKFQNIRAHDHVMFIAYDAPTQTTVQVEGTIKETNDTDHTQQTFDAMLRASEKDTGDPIPPVSKLYASYYTGLKLEPKQIRIASFAHNDASSTIYETITF